VKLASFSIAGRDRVGVATPRGTLAGIDDLLDAVGAAQRAPEDMLALIRADAPILASIRETSARVLDRPGRVPEYDPDRVSWHAPVRTPSKVVCLALNNRALDAIKIRAPTDHPAFFLKPHTALTGHLCPIRLRASFGLTHPEPELGVVVGHTLKDVTPEAAMHGVFGYTIVNDVTSVGMREEDSFSVRYFKPGDTPGSVVVGEAHTTYPGRYKASDTFAPMGPWLVTRDEIPDPAALRIECRLGDRLVASDHSKNYVWGVAQALAHISRTMTLLPGDIVSMGTAVGGDEDDPAAPHVPGVTRADLVGYEGLVSVAIEKIGTLANPVQMI
jgi:2-keto-4-pentenoate hydratase/2-oxohepta-3-ene-1,7-dioic acid hydratase in catechol pathway